MPRISVIIVAFNTKEILRDCLKNLSNVAPSAQVIVVDNGNDGTSQMVAADFTGVRLFSPGNIGLAAASNLGLSAATGDYILYLGADAFPQKGTVAGLADYMEANPTVGFATVKLVLRNGALDMDAHRGFPTPWASLTHFSKLNRLFPKSRLFNQYFLGYEDLTKPHEIDMCISHFMFVRRKVFETVGTWNEAYFLYGEDVDFCFRVKQAGWKIMYLPQWQAIHYKGVSVGVRKESADVTNATSATKTMARKKSVEAMATFYKTYYTGKYPKWVTKIVLAGIWLMGLARGL